jgi:hypothetical protein
MPEILGLTATAIECALPYRQTLMLRLSCFSVTDSTSFDKSQNWFVEGILSTYSSIESFYP